MGHPLNGPEAIESTDAGMVISVIASHWEYAPSSISVSVSGNLGDGNALQWEKADLPILFRPYGRSAETRLSHSENA